MSKVKITLDNREIECDSNQNLIQAAQSVGVAIPHYCYHPGLSIDGNCRMCLVEVEKMPKPVIACNTFPTEGMVVKTTSENVKKMRRSVMEFLLINHPLDCPTCDQAGECRLQDYYMSYDEIPSRFTEEKVHKEKMIDLGANVVLDQERCVACTCCIRVCKEIANTDELTLANRGEHVTITTFPGKTLTNPYAGNTIDVCPVGALTDKKFRYKKRVWLLKQAPSICPGCSRGCNIEIHHADERVYRLKPRFNPEVNQYWICDQGRYGFDAINEGRILRAHIRVGEGFVEVSFEEALEKLASLIHSLPSKHIGVVGHASQTNESLQAFYDFADHYLQTSLVYFSRYAPAQPFSDDKLITADKNPNQAFINQLGARPVSEIAEAKGLLVLDRLTAMEQALVAKRQIPILGLWGQNDDPTTKLATVILPIPSYAEQDGHFTNINGQAQKITRAFPPRGECRTITASLGQLTERLKNRTSQLAS